MTDAEIRLHIQDVVLRAVSKEEASRAEALRELLVLTMPETSDQSAEQLAKLVPSLPNSLYSKWAGQCADRMLETVPRTQILALCDPKEDNEAAIVLVYLMFMESARMEEEVSNDLIANGLMAPGDEMGSLLSSYLHAKLSTRKTDH